MSKATPSETTAFNAGADARIAGLAIEANPCPPESREYIHWRRGWNDCNEYFGDDAKWECMDLPDLPVGAA